MPFQDTSILPPISELSPFIIICLKCKSQRRTCCLISFKGLSSAFAKMKMTYFSLFLLPIRTKSHKHVQNMRRQKGGQKKGNQFQGSWDPRINMVLKPQVLFFLRVSQISAEHRNAKDNNKKTNHKTKPNTERERERKRRKKEIQSLKQKEQERDNLSRT